MVDKEEYSEAETAKRRDEVLKRMLSTPPQPHTAKGKIRVEKAPKVARTPKG